MEYLDLCKAVFRKEVVDWEIRKLESRKRQLVQARQISMYLGNWFWPHLTGDQLAEPFAKDRCTAMHAIKTMKNLMFSDRALRERIDRYVVQIRKNINDDIGEDINEEVFQQSDFFTN